MHGQRQQQQHHHYRHVLTAQIAAQLEAEPVKSNEQLWTFQVRSRDIDWSRFVCALDTGVRGEAVYLDKQRDFVSAHRRKDAKRELLICHDMMGNYLADR